MSEFVESNPLSESCEGKRAKDSQVLFDIYFKVFKYLQETNENTVFSPVGFVSKLALFLEHSKGKTAKELNQWLFHREDVAQEDVSQLKLKLQESLTTIKQSSYYLFASNFYLDSMYSDTINLQFIESTSDYFGCTLSPVSFTTCSMLAVREINEDAFYATFGNVKSIVGDVGSDMKALLVDVHFFKGCQEMHFPTHGCFADVFYCTKDEQIVQIGYTRGVGLVHCGFSSSLNSMIIEIPYRYSDVVLKIILPPKEMTISSFLRLSSQRDICKAIFNNGSLVAKTVELALPLVHMTSNLMFKDLLNTFSVSTIFNEKCDISGISLNSDCSIGLNIDDMIQKVVFSLNDNSTDTREIVKQKKHTPAIEVLQIGRPFIFAVLSGNENKKREILLMGSITNPLQY